MLLYWKWPWSTIVRAGFHTIHTKFIIFWPHVFAVLVQRRQEGRYTTQGRRRVVRMYESLQEHTKQQEERHIPNRSDRMTENLIPSLLILLSYPCDITNSVALGSNNSTTFPLKTLYNTQNIPLVMNGSYESHSKNTILYEMPQWYMSHDGVTMPYSTATSEDCNQPDMQKVGDNQGPNN